MANTKKLQNLAAVMSIVDGGQSRASGTDGLNTLMRMQRNEDDAILNQLKLQDSMMMHQALSQLYGAQSQAMGRKDMPSLQEIAMMKMMFKDNPEMQKLADGLFMSVYGGLVSPEVWAQISGGQGPQQTMPLPDKDDKEPPPVVPPPKAIATGEGQFKEPGILPSEFDKRGQPTTANIRRVMDAGPNALEALAWPVGNAIESIRSAFTGEEPVYAPHTQRYEEMLGNKAQKYSSWANATRDNITQSPPLPVHGDNIVAALGKDMRRKLQSEMTRPTEVLFDRPSPPLLSASEIGDNDYLKWAQLRARDRTPGRATMYDASLPPILPPERDAIMAQERSVQPENIPIVPPYVDPTSIPIVPPEVNRTFNPQIEFNTQPVPTRQESQTDVINTLINGLERSMMSTPVNTQLPPEFLAMLQNAPKLQPR